VLRRVLTCPLAALTLALGLAACGADEEPGASTGAGADTAAQSAPATTEAERTASGCTVVEQPEPKDVGERRRPRGTLPAGRRHEAVVRTSCGSFTIALDTRRAPRTAASFAALARDDFFDGTTFHRIVPEFVIQGGDPLGNGTGGPGYEVVEAPPENVTYPKYSVAMAKAQDDPAGASGSQFYVVTSDQANAVLEPIYAVLGRVTSGREVVDRIGALAADPQTQAPLEPVLIEDVRIRSRPR